MQQSKKDGEHHPAFGRGKVVQGGGRLDWKRVITSSELTLGRQVFEKQHNPRLLF